MAKKIYQVSSINNGIANNRKLCKPWQVGDLENIDLTADVMSVKLAGKDPENIINYRGEQGKIIHSVWDSYLTRDGYFEDVYIYNEAVLLKRRTPSDIRYTQYVLPKQVTKHLKGDAGWFFETNGRWETTVYWALSFANKSKYFDLTYTVLATDTFLHLIKSRTSARPNEIPSEVRDGAYTNYWGRTYQNDGYKHTARATTWIARGVNKLFQSFQFEFAFMEWTKGTVQVLIEYTGEEKTKNGKNYDSVELTKTYTETFRSERNGLINKIWIQGQTKAGITIKFTPSADFDGKLVYNGLYSWWDTLSNPKYFEELYGARINYHKIKSADKHPMIIISNKLYVGCWDKIEVYMINQEEDDRNGNIQLVEDVDVRLWVGMKIVSLTQYGNYLMIYANGREDAYQIVSDGSGSATESTFIRKGMQFVSVSNDGGQDFVITERQNSYQFWAVSGTNKQMLFSSERIFNQKNMREKEKYLFDFWGEASYSRMGRYLISSKENEVYLFDELKNWARGMSRFTLEQGVRISHIHEENQDSILCCTTNRTTKINSIQRIQLNNDYNTCFDGSITLPTLVSPIEEGQLESIRFWAYLPNEKSKIELRAMINSKDYFTFEVKNAEGKDFSKCKLQNQQGAWHLELIDSKLDNGTGYVSFRTVGELEKVKTFNADTILLDMNGGTLLESNNILSYDHYIKVEEITRANQKTWTKELWYTTTIDLRKLNAKIWTFNEVSIKLKLSAGGTAESPRVAGPIVYFYTTKENG